MTVSFQGDQGRWEQFAAIPSGRDGVFHEAPAARTLDRSKHSKALLFPLAALGLVQVPQVTSNVTKANTCWKLNRNFWYKGTHEALKNHC